LRFRILRIESHATGRRDRPCRNCRGWADCPSLHGRERRPRSLRNLSCATWTSLSPRRPVFGCDPRRPVYGPVGRREAYTAWSANHSTARSGIGPAISQFCVRQGRLLSSIREKFVRILYRDPAFEAFDDFSNFVESISCGSSESCQVRGSNPCRGAICSGSNSPCPLFHSNFGLERPWLPQLAGLRTVSASPAPE
jgi:hypothetical protein